MEALSDIEGKHFENLTVPHNGQIASTSTLILEVVLSNFRQLGYIIKV